MDGNIFNEQQYLDVQSNTFDLGHEHKTTMRFGRLYPMSVTEVLPGDKFTITTTKMLRMLALVSPVMHRITITEHWFFVPNRLVWPNWEKFITDSESGLTPPTVAWINPLRLPTNLDINQTLGAYMGLPILSTASNQYYVNAMPLAAYSLIWNEYYRDQQTMAEQKYLLEDGINTTGGGANDIDLDYAFSPALKSWKKDYFTSALPAAQKGVPVQIPLFNTDRVEIQANNDFGANPLWRRMLNDNSAADGTISQTASSIRSSGNAGDPIYYDPKGTLFIDNAEAVTMDTFRTALALQAFLVKDNVGGSRYTETIRAHFNATPPDFRLQRPEYICGNVQNVIISEVLSQTESVFAEGAYIPLGQMAGHGISVNKSGVESYYAPEHGWLMCLVSVAPDLNYVNVGLHRQWTRNTREQYAWPTFAHLGEQAILYKELKAEHNTPEATFGYTPQYSEYKYHISQITGQMSDTLKFWHLGIEVPDDVALNAEFLQVDDIVYDLTRIMAINPVQVGRIDDYMVVQMYVDMYVNRRLPRFAVPKLVG